MEVQCGFLGNRNPNSFKNIETSDLDFEESNLDFVCQFYIRELQIKVLRFEIMSRNLNLNPNSITHPL